MKRLKSPNWPRLFGYALFTCMLAAGYFYNLTFVQLGLEDYGIRLLGLQHTVFAGYMALLALLTCFAAIAFGWWMRNRGWGLDFRLKLRVSFSVVLTQTLLTLAIPLVRTETGFLAWLVFASLALGVGVPVMFSMEVDLIPSRSRGYAAALVTAAAYFAATVFSSSWTFEAFRRQSLALLLGGMLGVGILAFIRHPWLDVLASQHTLPEFARGRFVHPGATSQPYIQRRMLGLILIMFGVYFVDSLGFLRLLNTPFYMQSAWQSPELDARLLIGGMHVAGALAAGVLYSTLNLRSLFYWIFGIFALTHLQYSFHIRLAGSAGILSMPMLYALAVSLYTVVNFALWADLSTPETASVNTALGVALSAWTATFLSTALAIRWQESLSLERHIQIVDSLAILLLLSMLALAFFGAPRLRNGEIQA